MKKKQSDVSVKTKIVRVSAGLVWLLPCTFFLVFHILAIKPDTFFSFFGYLGAFFIGFSLFYAVATRKTAQLIRTAFSWKLFVPPLVIGLLLVVACIIVIFVPQLRRLFDETAVSHFFVLGVLLFLLAVFYVLIRHNIKVLLRRKGMRKSRINQLTKGMKNFWWYESVQKECSFGWLYYANKIFTMVFAGTAAAFFLVGWWNPAQRIIGIIIAANTLCCSATLFGSCCLTDFSGYDRQRRPFELSASASMLILCVFLFWIAIRVMMLFV